MPKSRPPYPSEFRERIIELVRKGRTPESPAEQFEPSAQTIRTWLAQAERDTGAADGWSDDRRARGASPAAAGAQDSPRRTGDPKKPVGHGAHRPTCETRNWRCGYADRRPGSRGRQLHGDISSPLKNMVRGRLAHLILVTPAGDPV